MSGEYSSWGLDWTFVADQDLPTYRFVTAASTVDYVKLAAGASNPIPFGVSQHDQRRGQAITVRIHGITLVEANAASPIPFGGYLTSNAVGQAVKATGPAAAAIALEPLSSGSGIYIKALLLPGGSVY